MLLTDVIYETLESYKRLNIKVSGIALGYSYYFYLNQILQTAAINEYEYSRDLTVMSSLLAKPFTYLGYPIYPLANEIAIEFLFEDANDAIKAASYKKAAESLVISSSPNVVPFRKK